MSAAIKDFDVLDFGITEASKAGVKMPFRHPSTGEPITHKAAGDKEERDLHLVLLGPEAPETTRVFAQLQHRAKKKGTNHSPSDAEIEEERISDAKAIARLVVSGLMYTGGKWVEITPKNAGDFLYQVGPLRQQAVSFVIDAGNFTAGGRG